MFTLPTENIFTAHQIRGNDERPKYLSGVTDISFYDINGEFFYNVGTKGKGMQNKVSKASLLYKVDVVKGELIMDKLLPLMSVQFVKFNDFTVVPYPFKYLREFIDAQ